MEILIILMKSRKMMKILSILMKSQKIMKILSIFIYFYDEKGTVLIGKEWKY